jgi:hypothetical protein
MLGPRIDPLDEGGDVDLHLPVGQCRRAVLGDSGPRCALL